jgi:pimeloyl-ACP methyl ester carboxylesterase
MAVGRPLVVILGWLGSKPRNLQKIARFYDGLDVDRESFIENPLSVVHIRSQRPAMEAIYQKSLNRPVLVHGFSLTGASSMMKIFTDLDMHLRPGLDVRGFIFDSMPCRLDVDLHRNAFPKALFPNSRVGELATKVVLTPIFDFVMNVKGALKWGEHLSRESFLRPWQKPTLLLGSEIDRLIPNSELVAYAEAARRAGAQVQTRFWPDSGHVRLSIDHQDEYRELVRAFAKEHLLNKK